jgi:hypothetical protein
VERLGQIAALDDGGLSSIYLRLPRIMCYEEGKEL